MKSAAVPDAGSSRTGLMNGYSSMAEAGPASIREVAAAAQVNAAPAENRRIISFFAVLR
jgi:hypothetical protein